MKKLRNLAALFALTMLMSNCANTKDIAYFQDLKGGSSVELAKGTEITFRPDDKMTIVVNASKAELASIYNLPVIGQRVGLTSTLPNSSYQMSLYTVDSEGYIHFPIIGKIHVAGMTREKVAAEVKKRLMESKEGIKDPTVTVEFANMYVTVMGEVARAGQYDLIQDKTTILDVLGKAGDLSIQALRTTVKLLRDEDGKRVCYTLDLTKGEELIKSPAYYLKQRDVIYVEPNEMRKRQTSVNGNNVLSTSFWISVASLLTSVAVLLKK